MFVNKLITPLPSPPSQFSVDTFLSTFSFKIGSGKALHGGSHLQSKLKHINIKCHRLCFSL